MRALILAAGLGTRLRPWTLHHPKALVPVAGIPMLERVLTRLENEGFNRIVVNIHHFGEQISEYLQQRKNQASICISNETDCLLDTGGGILQADALLGGDDPLLVHNVDILSNAPLQLLMQAHKYGRAAATLLTSNRISSRKLAFDFNGNLCGWIDTRNGEVRPADAENLVRESILHAFSGIYVMDATAIQKMREQATSRSFPIMDYFLSNCRNSAIQEYFMPDLMLLDIGKPEALAKAETFVHQLPY